MINTKDKTEQDVFHELFYAMLANMLPEEVARCMDFLLYGYQMGRASVLRAVKKEDQQ